MRSCVPQHQYNQCFPWSCSCRALLYLSRPARPVSRGRAYCAQVKDHLMKNIKRRMTPQPLKIRADIELTCFKYDGVLHIQARCAGLAALGLPF